MIQKSLIAMSLLMAHPAAAAETPLGMFKNTIYYFAFERDYSAPADAEIKAMDDTVLAVVSTPFKKALTMEGTGMLRDGRILNYQGRKNGEVRFAFTRHRYGRGVGNCPLVPFRSVAVDPKRVALGSKIRIEETVGMVLPDGSVHDGIWNAIDIGGAIIDARVDLFIEDRKYAKDLVKAGITHMKPLTVTLVQDPDPIESACLNELPE